MDSQVYDQLQNLKVKLEAVKDNTTPREEHRDILIEAVSTLTTILALYTELPNAPEKSSLLSRFKV